MKRIFSLLLVVSMLCAMMITANAATDASLAFSTESSTVTVGDTFVVAVNVTGDSNSAVGMKGGTFKIQFNDDTLATFDAIEAGTLSAGLTGGSQSTSTKSVNFSAGAADEWATGNGTYALLTFTAAKAGDFTISAKTCKIQFGVKGGTASAVTTIAPITIKIEDAAPAVPEAPAYAVESENYDDITVDDVIYQNVYVGEYSATPVAGVGISKIGVKNTNEEVVGSKDVAIEGGAKVTFKIALLGVEDGKDVGLTAFAEYDFAE